MVRKMLYLEDLDPPEQLELLEEIRGTCTEHLKNTIKASESQTCYCQKGLKKAFLTT